jgi:hypothetical protein
VILGIKSTTRWMLSAFNSGIRSTGSPAKQNSISLVVADHTLTVASEPPLTAMSCVSRRVSARSFTPPCSA